jgi:glycosyltransferase involved in cell wall biosynthesis
MKVLFVCRGKTWKSGVSPIVAAQASSLVEAGLTIELYTILGKGLFCYLKELYPLMKYMRMSNYEVIHAHYSITGILAYLAKFIGFCANRRKPPLVVSLMGSDVIQSIVQIKMLRLFSSKLWSSTIVKSTKMYESLGVDNVYVIPNGVSLSLFQEIDSLESKQKIGMEAVDEKIILFGADKDRIVKNFVLAQEAISNISGNNHKVLCLGGVPHELVPYYLNSCDVVLLTSQWEGSPNVIKEAMACNRPIVSTDVGDVRWLLEGVSGCYIATPDAQDIADKIEQALSFEGRTNGRERLIALHLDSDSVAKRLIEIYQEAARGKRKHRTGCSSANLSDR